ncbi:O-Antigen polymerase family protein [Listeria floridensis FSL S10-1187]|uniref:O-Antigen polymerase family protein n=1 Tax=Listeria floridensis FSL S10-1187 TaxID=1265817 RepID=A0ABN0RE99_9LIST|nr:O-antigen ligase family protein [Listeria floridensis]EUJ30961.1 O-Antigen polymerase family protein [Listeria floridensis FSL S10-1187]
MREKMQNLKFSKIGIILLFLAMSMILPIYPIAIILVVGIAFLYFIRQVSIAKINYVLFIVVVISGFWGPYLAVPGYPSLFLFRFALILHLLLFLFEKKDLKKLDRVKLPLILFAIWIIYAIVTLLWSGSISMSLNAIYFQFESFYLVFMMIYYIDSFAKLKQILIWVLGTYLLTIGIGFYENITGNHLAQSAGSQNGFLDTRPTGFMVNTNDYSSYLTFYFSLLSVFMLRNKKLFGAALWVAGTVALFYLIVETNSRSGLVAFVIIVVLVLYKVLSKNYFAVLAVGATLIGSIVYVVSKKMSAGSTSNAISYFSDKQNSTDERMFMYNFVWNLIKDNHFLGVGSGVTPKYMFVALFGTTNIDLSSKQTFGAHNFWLSNLSDVGILGIMPFAALFIFMSYYSIKIFITERNMLSLVPLCILISFAASSIGSSSIFEMRVVWIGMGFALMIINLFLTGKVQSETAKREIKLKQHTAKPSSDL